MFRLNSIFSSERIMAKISIDDDPLVSDPEFCEEADLKPTTTAGWRCHGKGPNFVKIGRRVFYRRSAINTWLRAQERHLGNAVAP
jgi:hypothetical protein